MDLRDALQAREQRRSQLIVLGALAICMLIPIVLSQAFFVHQSLRLDEAQSLWQTSRGYADVLAIVAGDVHVPLYHLLLRTWRLVVGEGVAAARALSLLAYVVSIPVFYLLGRRVVSRSSALFATVLFALSPFMNWYGSEVRMYTLFTLFVIANQYAFIRIMQRDRVSDHVWAGYVLSALAGMFVHYFFGLHLLAQAIFLLLRRASLTAAMRRRFLVALAIVVLGFAPWVYRVYTLGTATFQEPALHPPTSVDLFNTVSQFFFGFQYDNLNSFFLSLWPIVVVARLFALRRTERSSTELEYLLITVLVSFTTAFVASVLVSPIFVSRYLIFTVPSLYLLLASLFESYPARSRAFARGSVTLVVLGALTVELLSPTMPVAEHYAQAAGYLNEVVTAQDVVILSAPFTIYPVQYYYRGTAPITTLPVWDQYARGPIPAFDEATLPEQVRAATAVHQRVYVVLSYDQGYADTIRSYFDSNFERLSREEFSPGLEVSAYRVRYDTTLSAMPATP